MEQRRELRPMLFRDRAARKLLDAAARERAVLVVVEILHRESEDRKFLRQFNVERKIVERRYQLAMAQIAGAAEDHNNARFVVMALFDRMNQMARIEGPV